MHVTVVGGGNSTPIFAALAKEAGHTVSILTRRPSDWNKDDIGFVNDDPGYIDGKSELRVAIVGREGEDDRPIARSRRPAPPQQRAVTAVEDDVDVGLVRMAIEHLQQRPRHRLVAAVDAARRRLVERAVDDLEARARVRRDGQPRLVGGGERDGARVRRVAAQLGAQRCAEQVHFMPNTSHARLCVSWLVV